MKIQKINEKENLITVVPQSLDDLWHLDKIIEKGDLVKGKTDRKIKPKIEGEKTTREVMFVEIKVENLSYHEHSGTLKVNGIIVGGKPEELIELKSHHSVDIEIGKKITIIKETLKKWQIDRLKKAEKDSVSAGLLVVLLDDEQAELAFLDQFSIRKKAKIFSSKQGKQYEKGVTNYFEELYKKIISLEAKKVVLAGPGFTRENLKKFLEEKKEKDFPKIFSVSTNDIGETGFRELIKGDKIEGVEKELQLTTESKLIEEFMKGVTKGLAEYGQEKVIDAINLGAVSKLIISEKFLVENRKDAEKIITLAEKMGTETHIISSKNPNEEQVSGFGGVVAILRYKLE